MIDVDVKTDQEFSTLIPPPGDDELAGLESSLKADGCRDPLVVWNTDTGKVLVDGYNRFALCSKHKIPFNTVEREFADRDAAKIWILDNQLSRRNLSPFARTELVLKKKQILARPAREDMESGKGKDGSGGRGRKRNPGQNSAQGLPKKTRDKIANAAGVSHDTVSRVEKLIALAPAPTLEKLRKGEVSIHDAYKNLPRKPAARATNHKADFQDLDDFAVRVARRVDTVLTDDDHNKGLSSDLNALLRNAKDIKHGRQPIVSSLESLENRTNVMRTRFLDAGVDALIDEISSADEESGAPEEIRKPN